MRMIASAAGILLISSNLSAQRGPVATPRIRSVVQGSLISPDSKPFHLEANITEGQGAAPYATVQMDWISPADYREVISSSAFNSVRISSNGRFYEKDSADYFPLILQTLVTAMLDPKPIVDAVQEGDRVLTKSNGSVDESGVSCLDAQHLRCFRDSSGLKETVAASGHAVTFGNYQSFGQRESQELLLTLRALAKTCTRLPLPNLKRSTSPLRSIFQPTPELVESNFKMFPRRI
jgi:hypothetical protein